MADYIVWLLGAQPQELRATFELKNQSAGRCGISDACICAAKRLVRGLNMQ